MTMMIYEWLIIIKSTTNSNVLILIKIGLYILVDLVSNAIMQQINIWLLIVSLTIKLVDKFIQVSIITDLLDFSILCFPFLPYSGSYNWIYVPKV